MLVSAQQTGSVRAADQFIPGATVTAIQGETKVVGFTDESGQYKLNLSPGQWDIQIEMLGFTPVQGQITVGSEPGYKDWTLEMPRIQAASTTANTPATASTRTGGRRGFGQRQFPRPGGAAQPSGGGAPQPGGAAAGPPGSQPQRPGFQS